jgi:hypothetical protein
MEPQITLDAAGNAIAVWAQFAATSLDVWVNRYTAGGAWGTATLLEPNVGEAWFPQVAVDAGGNALAVWQEFDGARQSIYSSRYTAGGSWDTPALVEMENGGSATAPRIAMDASGNALAIWVQSVAGRLSIYGNRYTAGSGWGTPASIEPDGTGNASRPQIKMDASGNAMAVWSQSDGTFESIWANRYIVGAGWSTPSLLMMETDDAASDQNPQVTLDVAGNALAVWQQFDGTRENIWSNRYIAGAGWGTSTLIETNDAGPARNAQIAVDANGNALAVWQQSDGTRTDILASRFE